MIQISMTRLCRNRGIETLIAVVLFATLGAPARGAVGDSSKLPAAPASAGDETVAAIPANSSAPVAPSVAPSEASQVAAPSLGQVMELLQAQGQEIASLRAALRDQQELTARLEAKLNATSPALIVA